MITKQSSASVQYLRDAAHSGTLEGRIAVVLAWADGCPIETIVMALDVANTLYGKPTVADARLFLARTTEEGLRAGLLKLEGK